MPVTRVFLVFALLVATGLVVSSVIVEVSNLGAELDSLDVEISRLREAVAVQAPAIAEPVVIADPETVVVYAPPRVVVERVEIPVVVPEYRTTIIVLEGDSIVARADTVTTEAPATPLGPIEWLRIPGTDIPVFPKGRRAE